MSLLLQKWAEVHGRLKAETGCLEKPIELILVCSLEKSALCSGWGMRQILDVRCHTEAAISGAEVSRVGDRSPSGTDGD